LFQNVAGIAPGGTNFRAVAAPFPPGTVSVEARPLKEEQ
jgi:hypothetical protein